MEPNSSSRADRKTIEKNRRNHMKSLYSKLNSLVPHRTHKEVVSSSLPDQLHEAARYIKTLQMKLEKMREKKEALMLIEDQRANINASSSGEAMAVFRPPQIDIREVGSALEVVLVTGLDQHKFMFNETIRILHGEGAEVVNATYSVAEDAVFHTIHAKVGESNYSGYGAARISERLQKFVHAANYSFD